MFFLKATDFTCRPVTAAYDAVRHPRHARFLWLH
jgi:hypothetical protein